ncbi:hypothetical protein VC52_gp24 [Pseudomonas phage vB_PaeS_PAO1_Ab18]|uniref:Uncharacterized protein n=1 Tax=Pseudomonas phage vB_PaeS_PAO1_Ab18 TaxID=1548905 RepID=A0A0A1IUM2_9CAUD|nr:hypothetical protein VC52_gp24 [Pseudomonas phage vB_PaeS_PAO1_Ab18]CEF89663.1 hypothetical protein [Pseudomonas phage vB_PaeS_PAO1_Ab18]
MELFQQELTGELKAEALNLRELRKQTHEKNAPIHEQLRELASQAKALMKQVEANEEAFDNARTGFFKAAEKALGRDLDCVHLRIEDETDQVFIERTEEDTEGAGVKQALGRLLKALASGEAEVEVREVDASELEGCGDPDCQGCNPTIH